MMLNLKNVLKRLKSDQCDDETVRITKCTRESASKTWYFLNKVASSETMNKLNNRRNCVSVVLGFIIIYFDSTTKEEPS